MKFTFFIFFIFWASWLLAQIESFPINKQDWTSANIKLRDGNSGNCELKFTPGPIMVKQGNGVATIPPQDIISISFFDSTLNEQRVFESFFTYFLFGSKPRHSFIELTHSGNQYSLGKTYFKSGQIGNKNNSILFLCDMDQCFQISEGWVPLTQSYHINKPILKEILGSNYKPLISYLKKEKLKIGKLDHLVDGIHFLENR